MSTRTSLIVCDQARRPRVGKGARVSSGSHCETSFRATAEMDRQESDRLGRLLRMELDGAKTDRAVVAERWLDAELLQRQAILPEPNKSRPAPSLSHQVPNEHAENAGTRKRRNPEEASALEPIIERYPRSVVDGGSGAYREQTLATARGSDRTCWLAARPTGRPTARRSLNRLRANASEFEGYARSDGFASLSPRSATIERSRQAVRSPRASIGSWARV